MLGRCASPILPHRASVADTTSIVVGAASVAGAHSAAGYAIAVPVERIVGGRRADRRDVAGVLVAFDVAALSSASRSIGGRQAWEGSRRVRCWSAMNGLYMTKSCRRHCSLHGGNDWQAPRWCSPG